VRKVLVASVGSITTLFSKDFIRQVMLAIHIAIAVSWLILNKWLQDFS